MVPRGLREYCDRFRKQSSYPVLPPLSGSSRHINPIKPVLQAEQTSLPLLGTRRA
jgi:hypothetical protein